MPNIREYYRELSDCISESEESDREEVVIVEKVSVMSKLRQSEKLIES